jgi:hypothetical protein
MELGGAWLGEVDPPHVLGDVPDGHSDFIILVRLNVLEKDFRRKNLYGILTVAEVVDGGVVKHFCGVLLQESRFLRHELLLGVVM